MPDLARLKKWLQTALELELATIPPYMIGLLSIKRPGNREVAEILRGVMLEEMLHMALVSNVLNAIGGKPQLNADTIPKYPFDLAFEGKRFDDRQFQVHLAPFSEATVKTFLDIERPQDPDIRAINFRLEIPALTIGGFYKAMVELLQELVGADPNGIFVGDKSKQLEGDYFWAGGGSIIRVTDFATAKAALDFVADQGEGAPESAARRRGGPVPDFRMGHFFRFQQILHKRRYLKSDDPARPPTGPEIAVDYNAVYPCKIDPKSSDYPEGSDLAKLNSEFNIRYTALLRQVEDAMNGEPKSLYDAILDHMRAMSPIAHEMMKLPLDGDPDGRVGCPTFEWM